MTAAAPAALAYVEAGVLDPGAPGADVAGREGRLWPSVLGAYLLSRVVVLVAAAAVATFHYHRIGLTARVLGLWDGYWYLTVAKHGYAHAVPAGSGAAAQSTLAFFPLYPMLVRVVHAALPVNLLSAGLLVSWIAGGLACGAVAMVGRQVLGARRGRLVGIAFAFFPGAFILSMAYAESVMIALSALCLLALLRRQWWLAGVAAALATAARPNALPLVLACLVAAGTAMRAARVPGAPPSAVATARRAWVAPLLAPIGTAGFFLFLWARTGSPLAWFRAERAGWVQQTDFGLSTVRTFATFLRTPLRDGETVMVTGALVFSFVLGRLLWKSRPPLELVVYTAAVLFLCFGASSLGGRPRFVLAAFPLLFPLSRLPRPMYWVWIGCSALALGLLLWFAGTQFTAAP